MSPSTLQSACYTAAACKTERDLSAMVSGGGKDDSSVGGVQFGIARKQESGCNSPRLRVSRDSHRIRKPSLPLPQVQYRPPIIIHTYSPKIIHTQPDGFMSLVQKLTGSSDTRLRLKQSPSSKKDKGASTRTESRGGQSADATILERQGSGGSSTATTNCGSPSSSEDTATCLVADQSCGGSDATVKQSNSPRSPFDSSFEFDNNVDSFSMFSPFVDPSTGTMFTSQVKVEPMFSFTENASFNAFADFMHPVQASKASPKPVPRPQMPQHEDIMSPYANIDIHSSLPSPVLVSPNPMATLPDLSPAWSLLDCLNAPPGSHFVNQAPYLRQRQFSGGYATPSPDGTLVALENIQAFLST